MVKIIDLTKGYLGLVDASDYELVVQWKWSFSGGYIRRQCKGQTFSLHRQILGLLHTLEVHVDHINGDGLDNRRENLRVCTPSQNMANRGLYAHNKTGFKGVCVDRRSNQVKYRATIHHKNKYIALGRFNTAEEAAHAYDVAALKLFGEFANVNIERGLKRDSK